jgi:two-component system nitrate/nitrite response regulator NarL
VCVTQQIRESAEEIDEQRPKYVRPMGRMMTVPRNEPVVLIIDALPLRSLGLVSILSRLDHLGFAGKTRIISHLPDAAERWIEAHANCEMLIYNVGGASIADRDNSQRIKALRAIAPDVPLVIFSESESREEIISALNVGAQGLLYAGMNSELALQAFSFILNGGSYFPSALRPRRPYPQRHPTIDCNRTPSCVNGGSSAEDLKDADLTDRNLTARQGTVLELLSRGNSNKVIARRLAMSEGTVKFHVRQIMRKFGVTNRTQVAVVSGVRGFAEAPSSLDPRPAAPIATSAKSSRPVGRGDRGHRSDRSNAIARAIDPIGAAPLITGQDDGAHDGPASRAIACRSPS